MKRPRPARSRISPASTVPYEAPERAELTIKTVESTPEEPMPRRLWNILREKRLSGLIFRAFWLSARRLASHGALGFIRAARPKPSLPQELAHEDSREFRPYRRGKRFRRAGAGHRPGGPAVATLSTWASASPISVLPDHIVEAAAKALRDGHHGYTPANGILPLREAVSGRSRTSVTASRCRPRK